MTREGRLREFSRLGWVASDVPDPSDPKTFAAAKLDWNFSHEQHQLVDAYTRLLSIRREHGFNRDDLRALQVDHGETWLTMRQRDAAPGSIVFAGNFSDTAVTVPVSGELLYSFTSPRVDTQAGELRLDPWGFAVLIQP